MATTPGVGWRAGVACVRVGSWQRSCDALDRASHHRFDQRISRRRAGGHCGGIRLHPLPANLVRVDGAEWVLDVYTNHSVRMGVSVRRRPEGPAPVGDYERAGTRRGGVHARNNSGGTHRDCDVWRGWGAPTSTRSPVQRTAMRRTCRLPRRVCRHARPDRQKGWRTFCRNAADSQVAWKTPLSGWPSRQRSLFPRLFSGAAHHRAPLE